MPKPTLESTENTMQPTKQNTKRENFVRIAERRTNNAIKAIRIIGKLNNRAAYSYDDADVRKITKALSDEIEALKTRMSATHSADSVDFKL